MSAWETKLTPDALLLETYAHLLPHSAEGSKAEVLEALLGAAVELPDGQREAAIQAIMEVYEASAPAPAQITADPCTSARAWTS